jgi:hypothetical protein
MIGFEWVQRPGRFTGGTHRRDIVLTKQAAEKGICHAERGEASAVSLIENKQEADPSLRSG